MDIPDLPDLALLKVFSYFSNEEKIKLLMLVCKRWYSLLQADFQQLCIYDRRVPHRLFWDVFAKLEVDHKYIMRTKRLTEKFAIRFRNLKRLFLFKVTSWRLFLSSLSYCGLDQLVELRIVNFYRNEIDLDPNLDYRLDYKISLPSLKKLCSDDGFHLGELRVPNLESIAGPFRGLIAFPEKIKFVWCQSFKTIQIFSNLEHLICRRINGVLPLEAMPKLKRVELFPYAESDFETIEDLRTQKNRLNRQDLLIWFSGFKENCTPDLFRIFWDTVYSGCSFDDPLNPLNPFDHFDYNEPLCVFPYQTKFRSPHLMRKFPNLQGIPENFFKVFIDIRELQIAGGQVDGESLIRFLQKANNIQTLHVSDNRFNENFFHELSRIQSIQILRLRNVFPPSAFDSDFDIGPMLNLQNVQLMEILAGPGRLKISAQLFFEFLRDTRGKFEISSRNKAVSFRNYPKTFYFSHNYSRELAFDSLDELISHAEYIARSKETIFYFEA